jgi:hypothetical protein
VIAKAKGSIDRLDDGNYVVNSRSGNGSYKVQLSELCFMCSCPDSIYRGAECKHIHAVELAKDSLL